MILLYELTTYYMNNTKKIKLSNISYCKKYYFKCRYSIKSYKIILDPVSIK